MLDLIKLGWRLARLVITGVESDYLPEFCQFTSHAVSLTAVTALTDGDELRMTMSIGPFLAALTIFFGDQIANSRSRSNTWETIKLILSIFPFCRDRLTAHITQAVRGD